MIWMLIVLGLITVTLGLYLVCEHEDYLVCVLVFLSYVFGVLFACYHFETIPTALDVYRGRTTLEITSVNGVPTDTVVVFKNKEK